MGSESRCRSAARGWPSTSRGGVVLPAQPRRRSATGLGEPVAPSPWAAEVKLFDCESQHLSSTWMNYLVTDVCYVCLGAVSLMHCQLID